MFNKKKKNNHKMVCKLKHRIMLAYVRIHITGCIIYISICICTHTFEMFYT